MDYALNSQPPRPKVSVLQALKGLAPLLHGEQASLVYAALATICNSLVNLTAPLLIAHIVDTYISKGQFDGMLRFSGILSLTG